MFIIYGCIVSEFTSHYQTERKANLIIMLGSIFGYSNSARKYKWVKGFLHHIKTYKQSGVRLREAQLLSPEGDLMARDGEAIMTDNDVMVSVHNSKFCNLYWLGVNSLVWISISPLVHVFAIPFQIYLLTQAWGVVFNQFFHAPFFYNSWHSLTLRW